MKKGIVSVIARGAHRTGIPALIVWRPSDRTAHEALCARRRSHAMRPATGSVFALWHNTGTKMPSLSAHVPDLP